MVKVFLNIPAGYANNRYADRLCVEQMCEEPPEPGDTFERLIDHHEEDGLHLFTVLEVERSSASLYRCTCNVTALGRR
ncbi:MAG: hypothetical protein AB7S38_18410 [Vulcanimicrobiota bacterium]